mgnify:FL=1
MSRAFVNEDQAADQANPPVERRISAQPNHVTAHGLTLLRQRVGELEALRSSLLGHPDKQRLAEVERDLRYFSARVQSAQVAAPATSQSKVQIGSRVVFVDEDGRQHEVQLVGEDQAYAASGLINWGSPLGRALLGAAPGDEVLWRRPAGDQLIEVVAIEPQA